MTATWTPVRGRGFGRHVEAPRRSDAPRMAEVQRRRRLGELPENALYTPPGWPDAVRPPHAPDWESTAAAFLLDCCPAEYRLYPVLRRHPVVLARFAAEHVESQIAACRDGLGGVRASLEGVVTPEVVTQATAAWQEQAAALQRRRREVALVEEALRGKVFLRKL